MARSPSVPGTKVIVMAKGSIPAVLPKCRRQPETIERTDAELRYAVYESSSSVSSPARRIERVMSAPVAGAATHFALSFCECDGVCC